MSDPGTTRLIVPNDRTPRTIGILNIVFGALIILMGICSGMSMAVMPAFTRMIESIQKQAADQFAKQKQAQIEQARAREQAAQTDEEREAIRQEIKSIEARPTPTMPAMMDYRKMGMSDPRFLGFFWFDFLTMLALNVLMIVAGVGLMRLSAGARSLAVWVAGIKVGRLVLIAAIWCIVIVPFFSRGIAEMVVDMFRQQQQMMGRGAGPGPAFSVQDFARIYGVTYTAMGVLGALAGMIYPGICLWALTRPAVKVACAGPSPERSSAEKAETVEPGLLE